MVIQLPGGKIETVNYLNIPAGVPIQFKLTSVGPMNAFGYRTWWYEVHNGWHDYGSLFTS